MKPINSTSTERHLLLRDAESKAAHLFAEVERLQLIRPGITEKTLNTEVYQLAFEMYGIKKYWHKRIVRAGRNTLYPYRENPPVLTIKIDASARCKRRSSGLDLRDPFHRSGAGDRRLLRAAVDGGVVGRAQSCKAQDCALGNNKLLYAERVKFQGHERL